MEAKPADGLSGFDYHFVTVQFGLENGISIRFVVLGALSPREMHDVALVGVDLESDVVEDGDGGFKSLAKKVGGGFQVDGHGVETEVVNVSCRSNGDWDWAVFVEDRVDV